MAKYENPNKMIIINGYIRDINDCCPMDIIDIIHEFYDSYMIFNVFVYQNLFNDNCIYFNIISNSFFYIKNDYTLYVNGVNDDGQLGLECLDDVQNSRKHNYFDGRDIELIRNVSINGNHSFIYTRNHKLYGFGNNNHNQTGIIDSKECIQIPTLIEFDFEGILVKIQSGENYTIFLNDKGNVYGCGFNILGCLTNKYNSNVMTSCSIQNIMSNNNIKDIGCCSESSYALNDDNILYAFGDNKYGQLGIFLKSINWSDDILIAFNHKKIKTFNTGHKHIGIITINDELHMFGHNYSKQCGFDSNTDVYSCHYGNKIKLPNKSKIISVQCGSFHTILKTIKNDYYSFGNNVFDQLLLELTTKTAKISEPTKISMEYLYKLTNSKNKIIDLIPGWNTTFIIQKTYE